MSYSLPRKIFVTFEEVFGREKAELISSELEQSIEEKLFDSSQNLKTKLKEELKDELATKEDIFALKEDILAVKEDITLLKADIKIIEERFKLLDFKLNIVIGIAVLALTLFNPALLAFLTKVFKL